VALAPGARLGAYEILSLIGQGGMGEVYRATDTKLRREVAIKVLPEAFAADPERTARFQREAELLATLNHPNIAAVYGVEDSAGVTAIVLELVEGETLADRIARGPLEIDDAIAVARQLVDALEAAHDRGVIHRDLKPANIKVTPDGKVKVLDFGLAKMAEREARVSGLSFSPTLSIQATYAGTILGTAAYMSPEQARGKPVDRKTDIWAFGCVLYEMLTGKQAFEGGETVSDSVASILRSEVDWAALPLATPSHVATVLRRCLQKDPQKRLPHIGPVRLEFDDAERNSVLPDSTISRSGPSRRATFVVASAALVAAMVSAAAAASIVWWVMRARPLPPQRPARLPLMMPADLPIWTGSPDRSIVIAPDGAHVVSVNGSGAGGGGQLMVRSLDQLEPLPIKGVAFARAPFVSPDSRWIGYFESGELKKVPMGGGPPITICRIRGGTRGSTWGPDNTIVYATNDSSTGLSMVPAGGGEPEILTKADTTHGEVDHLFPSFLPGGHVVLFTISTTGSIDNGMIASLDIKTGERKTLVRGASFAEYAPSGHLLYASGGSLHAVRFDPERLEVLSDPVVVADQIRTEPSGAAQFTIAPTGAFAYLSGGSGNYEARTLVWVDRRGREQPVSAPVRAYLHPRLSPDGSRVAVAIADQEQDIWILDLARQTLTPLTFGSAVEQYPVWTPDGRRVLFRSDRSGIPNLFWQFADGTGTAEQVTAVTQTIVIPDAITPDSKALVVQTGVHIGIIGLDDRQKVSPVVEAPGIQSNAALSPDGRWLAYSSDESGTPQIFVRPFPNVDAGRWQVSSNGGTKPVWRGNGQELFYLGLSAAGASLMAVPVHTTDRFSFGNPTKLFDGRPYYTVPLGRTYDVSADGQRFLMIKPTIEADPSATPVKAVLVLNWTEELKQRVPVK
jgi:serine/threonine-protein kinase